MSYFLIGLCFSRLISWKIILCHASGLTPSSYTAKNASVWISYRVQMLNRCMYSCVSWSNYPRSFCLDTIFFMMLNTKKYSNQKMRHYGYTNLTSDEWSSLTNFSFSSHLTFHIRYRFPIWEEKKWINW